MKQLQITTRAADGHDHIVYTNSEQGYGGMSPGPDGHTHELIYDPPRDPVEPTPEIPPQIDPLTGQPVLVQDPATGQMIPDPGTPANPGDPGKPEGSWIVAPAGGPVEGAGPEDGTEVHEHELTEYKAPKPKEQRQPENEILDECMSLWRESLDLTADSRKKAKEARAFVKGDQWEDGVKRSLEATDRAALTINEIAPNINTLMGYQMESRTDIRYLPTENGDQRISDMLNIITKKILDNCYYSREESKVFKDQSVGGFAVFHLGMNFAENIQGEIFVERFPCDDIHYGPHEKEDLSDCEYEVRSRMQSIAKLKQLHGSKADEIEKSYKGYAGEVADSDNINGTNMDYSSAKTVSTQPYTVDGTFPLVDVQKKQFRYVQCTRKKYLPVTVIFNESEEFFLTAYDWPEKDIARAGTIAEFQVLSQLKTRMRVTRFCGTVILSDENPADLPVHDFMTVPVYAHRDEGEYWGIVEAAKDPQRELNKRRSQMMDTMNRLGASVIFTEPDMFADINGEEKFKKNRAKPGSVHRLTNLDRKPIMEAGAEVPLALIQIMQLDQENLQRLMNIIIKEPGANTSGAAISEEKKGRITGNQFLFDNLAFAKQKLGKLLLPLVQEYYSAERLHSMLNAENSRSPFQLAGEDFSQFSKEEIIELLETKDLLENDVIVTDSSFAPSTRLAIAQMLLDLMAKGAQVPPALPFKFIDMPADLRKEVTDQIDAQSQQQAQAASDTSNTEIKKTVIANGQYTISPQEAEQMGLVPANQPLPESEAAPNNTDIQDTEYADNLASSLAG